MVGAKDTNPLIAWGLGAANLQPVWVKYVDGVPVYTVPKVGQTGSHTETNPLYKPAYDAAYDLAHNYDVAYGVVYAQIFAAARSAAYERLSSGCGGGFGGQLCRANAQLDAAAEAKRVADAQAPAAATAEAQRIALAAALAAVANIPQTITVPDYGITDPGYWTTPTAGQWINPTDLSGVPALGLVDYFASGERGYLAPVLNWTAYLTNVNLIAYGDGANGRTGLPSVH